MELLFLTKTGGILSPFATVLGWLINLIYIGLEKIGIPNIGLAIILFTIVINLILLPLTIKQQKFTKLSAVMNPEIQKIQAKYKDKRDEESMRMMQAETQAVHQKYGTSTMGGCLYMIIQMPILFALYRVIYNIPAYVGSVKNLYTVIAEPILNMGDTGMNLANELLSGMSARGLKAFTPETFNLNKIIDFLYVVKTTSWEQVVSTFNLGADAQASIEKILNIAKLPGGLSISDPPTGGLTAFSTWWPGVIIPILAGLTQWLSIKITTAQQGNAQAAQGDTMGNQMKMMNTIMPLFSVVICFTLQAGLGIYWIASAVVRTILSVIINKMIDREGLDAIIEKNREKARKKAEKRGENPSRFQEYARQSTKRLQEMQAAQAQAQAKRSSISDLAGISVEGKGSSSQKEKQNTKGSIASAASISTASVSSDSDVKKSGKKDKNEETNIAAYANMLKRK